MAAAGKAVPVHQLLDAQLAGELGADHPDRGGRPWRKECSVLQGDNWLLCGYRYEGCVIFVACEDPVHDTSHGVLAVSIDQSTYDSIFELAHMYWARCETVPLS